MLLESPDFLVDAIGTNAAELVVRIFWAVVLFALVLLARRWSVVILRRITHLTARTNSHLDDSLVQALTPPVKLTTTIVGIWLIFLVIELPRWGEVILDTTASTLVVGAIFWAFYRLVDVISEAILLNPHREAYVTDTIIGASAQVSRAIVLTFAFVVIMQQWGYDLGGVIAGLGIGGLAVALAAQDTLSNLIGYFALIADSPFEVNNYIVVGEVQGVVEKIGFRSTQIRQLDQSMVYIPNRTMANANIINWSRLSKRRLNTTLSLHYGNSSSKVLTVVNDIREMVKSHERVIEGTTLVQFVGIEERPYGGDEYTALRIMIIAMTDIADWNAFQKFREDISLRILDILAQNKVNFPNLDENLPTYTELKEAGILRDSAPTDIELDEDNMDVVPADAANEAGDVK